VNPGDQLRKRLHHLAALLLVALAVFGMFAPPAHADDLAIKVRVQNQVPDAATGKTKKEPVAGVKVSVADDKGAKIGEAVTDDKGVATIAVPGQADYKVTLDESTLPEGFALQEGGADRSVGKNSFITSTVTVTYFTGAASRATVGWWAQLAQRIVDGIRFGLILAMCAVGLSLIYGTTGLTNFAHGEMVTFGAMIAYILNTDRSITPWIAFPVAIIAGGAFGLAQNQLIYSPLRKRNIGLVSQMVVTVGVAIVLKNIFLRILGGRTKVFAAFNNQSCKKVGPICVTPREFATSTISLIILVGVALTLQRTRLGKATRAVSDNPDLASSTGIDSQQIIRLVWILGGMLAATGGIFRGLDEGVGPFIGSDLLFLMFAGITLGGLGSAYGALVGSFVIGLFVEVSTLGIPIAPGGNLPPPLDWLHNGVPSELKNVPAYVAMIVVLLVRPQGILGRRERVG
jgi:branched-chain amino acid transport system permease protein